MKFKLKIKYVSVREIEIEAKSEAYAKDLNGEILNETEVDFYEDELLKCDEIKTA